MGLGAKSTLQKGTSDGFSNSSPKGIRDLCYYIVVGANITFSRRLVKNAGRGDTVEVN